MARLLVGQWMRIGTLQDVAALAPFHQSLFRSHQNVVSCRAYAQQTGDNNSNEGADNEEIATKAASSEQKSATSKEQPSKIEKRSTAVNDEAFDDAAKVDELLQVSHKAFERIAQLQVYTLLHGRKGDIPEDLSAELTDDKLQKELRYLLPTQLKLNQPPARVMKKKYGDLPDKAPQRMHSHRPVSPAHFTGRAEYYDRLLELEKMYEELQEELEKDGVYQEHDKSEENEKDLQNITWLKKEEMERDIGMPLRVFEYRELLSWLTKLWTHPKSSTIRESRLSHYLRSERAVAVAEKKIRQVDDQGRGYGTGRRKTSVARVWVSRADDTDSKITINGNTLALYFPKLADRVEVLKPFRVTNGLGDYNVTCTVMGGGSTGQAGAVRLGISKALEVLDPSLRGSLKQEGLLRRDTRVAERKKPGQKKARKKFQWVKR